MATDYVRFSFNKAHIAVSGRLTAAGFHFRARTNLRKNAELYPVGVKVRKLT
jgi:hypothetical protein